MQLEVNQKELAQVLGLTTRQVHNLTEEAVLPSRPAENGRDRLYVLDQAVPAYVRYKVASVRPTDRDEADARRARAQARLAELELEEREGSLIPLAVHKRVTSEAFAQVRANMLSLPGSVATQLGIPPREAVAILRPAVDRCLTAVTVLADDLDDRAAGLDSPIPEDFPGADALTKAGVRTLGQLRRRLKELQKIPGIGPKTAKKIRAHVEAAA